MNSTLHSLTLSLYKHVQKKFRKCTKNYVYLVVALSCRHIRTSDTDQLTCDYFFQTSTHIPKQEEWSISSEPVKVSTWLLLHVCLLTFYVVFSELPLSLLVTGGSFHFVQNSTKNYRHHHRYKKCIHIHPSARIIITFASS